MTVRNGSAAAPPVRMATVAVGVAALALAASTSFAPVASAAEVTLCALKLPERTTVIVPEVASVTNVSTRAETAIMAASSSIVASTNSVRLGNR